MELTYVVRAHTYVCMCAFMCAFVCVSVCVRVYPHVSVSVRVCPYVIVTECVRLGQARHIYRHDEFTDTLCLKNKNKRKKLKKTLRKQNNVLSFNTEKMNKTDKTEEKKDKSERKP